MTDESPHPGASLPILQVPRTCSEYWPDRLDLEAALVEFTVQVYHDRVACLYQLSSYGGRDMVVVWNWRSGDVVKVGVVFQDNAYVYAVQNEMLDTDFPTFIHRSSILLQQDNTQICHFSPPPLF